MAALSTQGSPPLSLLVLSRAVLVRLIPVAVGMFVMAGLLPAKAFDFTFVH